MSRRNKNPCFPAIQHNPLLSWPGRRLCDRIATISVSSVTRGGNYEFAMAGAVTVLGLVKSARVVVVSVDAREHHQYRGLVLAVPLPAETADRQSRQYVRHRADALSLRGIRLRLRVQIVPSARGCSADLPVRYLAL